MESPWSKGILVSFSWRIMFAFYSSLTFVSDQSVKCGKVHYSIWPWNCAFAWRYPSWEMTIYVDNYISYDIIVELLICRYRSDFITMGIRYRFLRNIFPLIMQTWIPDHPILIFSNLFSGTIRFSVDCFFVWTKEILFD